MKKLFALLLALSLVLTGLVSVCVAEGEAGLPEMNTTDPITLTFFDTGWGYNHAMARLMAAAFHEKYPNITVEIVNLPGDHNGYEEALTNELANGTKFDIARGFASAERNTSSKIMYDCTEFVLADPDYADIAPALAAGGWFGTDHCFAFPGGTVDDVLFIETSQLERLNVEIPSRDWTFEDYCEFLENASNAENGYFALTGSMLAPDCNNIAMTPDAIGTMGWDGQHIDMTAYAEVFNLAYGEWLNGDGIYTWNGRSDYKAFVPDDVWIGTSNRISVYMHFWDNFPTMLDPNYTTSLGLKYIPYMLPATEGAAMNSNRAQTAYYFINADCEHPREAYEALKWINWGKEGWLYRLENNYYARACMDPETGYYLNDVTFWDAYAQFQADGTPIAANYIYSQYGNTKASPFELPPIADDEVNKALAKSYPNLGYWGTEEDWYAFFSTRTNPVPDVSNVAVGWSTFNNTVLYNGVDYNGTTNFEQAIMKQLIDPMDYVEMWNKAFDEIHAEAMKTFGEVYGIEIK